MRLLIVFNRASGVIEYEREFSDDEAREAVTARLQAEQEYSNREVVVLNAGSRDAMQRTHLRYFAEERK